RARSSGSSGSPRVVSRSSCAGFFREESRQLLRVLDRVVSVAVVHENVDVAGAAGEIAQTRHPLAQLVGPVEVAEALGRADARAIPGGPLAAVEADDREIVGGRGDDRRDARARALRLVHHDVDQRVPAQEVERAGPAVLGHPAGLAELDGERGARQASTHGLEEPVALARRREPLRHLEEDVGELAGAAERLERRMEAPPDLVRDAGWEVTRVYVPACPQLARELLLELP